jgi:hypothetical protein
LAFVFFVPACPARRYGAAPVRLTFFAQVVAAIDTVPWMLNSATRLAAWKAPQT